jgi:hypothetical protein
VIVKNEANVGNPLDPEFFTFILPIPHRFLSPSSLPIPTLLELNRTHSFIHFVKMVIEFGPTFPFYPVRREGIEMLSPAHKYT